MNALTKIEQTSIASMPESELMEVLQSSLYPGANIPSIKLVLGYCKAAGLDPMRKPVHIVPMWDGKAKQMRDVVMPGIGLYRTDASRTEEHVGTDDPVFGPMVEYELSGTKVTVPEWCRVTVYRLKGGMKCAFTATEYWIENYATAGKDTTAPNTMWKKRYRGQLAKCAEAQALRKAFPEVGSQPTADEMEGKTIDMGPADVVGAPPPPPPAPPVWPDDKFAAQLPRWTKAVQEGLKTTAEIINLAKTKGDLTPAQEAQINAIKAPATTAPDTGEITMTFAAVADKLGKASDMDKLAEAGSLIAMVQDEGQRRELTAIYDRRAAELAN